MDCGSIGPDSSTHGSNLPTVSSDGRRAAMPRYDARDGPVIYAEELTPGTPFNRDAFYGLRGKGSYGTVVVPGSYIAAMAGKLGLSPDVAMMRIKEDVGRIQLGVVEYAPVGTPPLHGRRNGGKMTLRLPSIGRNMTVSTVVPLSTPCHGDGGVM